MITDNNLSVVNIQVPLGPNIGQCCGGTVILRLNITDADQQSKLTTDIYQTLNALPSIYVFGAGHVGHALVRSLSLLPVKTILIDTRPYELNKAPKGIETHLTALPESVVDQAPPGSSFIILTHDHSLDFLIASQALMRGDAAYVGMIGSNTKRAKFHKWLKRQQGENTLIDALVCPIASDRLGDKRPEVIAAMATAEVVNYITHYKQSKIHA